MMKEAHAQHTRINSEPGEAHGEHRGHGLMMIACCIPMLVIAVVLVATDVVNPAFLLTAIACTLMMAAMMRVMSGGGRDGG